MHASCIVHTQNKLLEKIKETPHGEGRRSIFWIGGGGAKVRTNVKKNCARSAAKLKIVYV